MGASQPFSYAAERSHNAAAFPTTTFDPKAVTRASWEPKPRKPTQHGPLVSFNKHPDAHALVSHQLSHHAPLTGRTKKWIKGLRVVQLLCRVLELNCALGNLVLLILITNISEVTGRIMRILPGAAMIHCLYAIYHLSRKASGRAAGSSAAYHLFAAIFDLAISSLYAFGAYSTYQESSVWTSRFNDQNLTRYFVLAIYYMFIAAGGMHLISLSISSWLGIMFRRISLLPPDMNPLEANLTARPFHEKNKSPRTTASSISDGKRHSTSKMRHYALGFESDADSQAPLVPFLHAREGSGSPVRNSIPFINLPNRRYQLVPGNSPRGSIQGASEKRNSAAVSPTLGACAALSTANQREQHSIGHDERTRPVELTDTWMPTNTLASRTNHRHHIMSKSVVTSHRGNHKKKDYNSLAQAPKYECFSDDSDYDEEHCVAHDRSRLQRLVSAYPNALRSHPAAELKQEGKASLPAVDVKPPSRERIFRSQMSEILRRISNSQDTANQTNGVKSPWKIYTEGSVPLDDDCHSRLYGELTSGTSPLRAGGDRKISSGVDYGMGNRRIVSGKIAEEGRGYR